MYFKRYSNIFFLIMKIERIENTISSDVICIEKFRYDFNYKFRCKFKKYFGPIVQWENSVCGRVTRVCNYSILSAAAFWKKMEAQSLLNPAVRQNSNTLLNQSFKLFSEPIRRPSCFKPGIQLS